MLLSQATADLVRDALPAGAGLRDLGEHRLRDLARPEHVFQLLHPDLPADFPPLRSLDAYPHNLPLQLTSFVGRERELAEVAAAAGDAPAADADRRRRLRQDAPGAAGRRRRCWTRYPDGVWLVELAPLADPALVPQAVAAALGVASSRASRSLTTLVGALRRRRLLLVLDNCEHLLDACAALAEALLRGCPGLRLLATSREALGVAGEVAWRVPSLAPPDPRTCRRSTSWPRSRRCGCSSSGRGWSQPAFARHRPERGGGGARSAGGWTASRWRSSWRRRA